MPPTLVIGHNYLDQKYSGGRVSGGVRVGAVLTVVVAAAVVVIIIVAGVGVAQG